MGQVHRRRPRALAGERVEFDPEKDKLGEGPLSEVFRAQDTKLERIVALKILRPEYAAETEFVQRPYRLPSDPGVLIGEGVFEQ